MLEKNQIYKSEITDVTSEGSGVCHIDGFAVFVPETAVGDVIQVKIVKVLKNYAYGIVDSIITPSPDRIKDSCPVFRQCGGCVFRHIDYEAECRIKSDIIKNAFIRIGGLSPEFDKFIPADSTVRYRNKAQYPVASIDGKAVCGFFAQRSHRLIPVTNCELQSEVFSDILDTIIEYINERHISAYSEKEGTGIVRHIYLRQGYHSGEIMVCIVVRKDISRQLMPVCGLLTEKYPDIRSIIMNINPDKTNVILGNKCVILWGNDTIKDVMCGNIIEISPLSFYQVNTIQAEKLYAKALEYAAPDRGDIIADLYCGAGTIGLFMAGHADRIIGIEIVPDAVKNAESNALINSISNAEFYAGDAGEIFSKLHANGCSPDIIIVDPPRKGCSKETIDTIAEAFPEKVVMVSCNPATAARDAKTFTELGYTVEKVCGADLFPRTKHVECVVLMSRDKA